MVKNKPVSFHFLMLGPTFTVGLTRRWVKKLVSLPSPELSGGVKYSAAERGVENWEWEKGMCTAGVGVREQDEES